MSGRRMLFHRDFRFYTGGHGKVWDYFCHALAQGWDARVYLTPDSVRGDGNPWASVPDRIEPEWQPADADVLFLAGMDWLALPPGSPGANVPVINLVQAVRHAHATWPLRQFLARPAHRICVSSAVADAILGTREVDGPVTVIPAALDLGAFDVPAVAPSLREGVFIGAVKNPPLGAAILHALDALGVHAQLLTEPVARTDYLAMLATAQLAILLPQAEEGFYLPGLEAMALGTPLLTLDALGNREYLRPGMNAVVVTADAAAIAREAHDLLKNLPTLDRLAATARHTVSAYDLPGERAAFAALLATSGVT